MWQTIKNIFWWNYPRTSWQWDVLCLLIIAFIFFTPKSWFEGRERTPLTGETTKIIISSEVLSPAGDKSAIEKRVRELTGNPNTQVVDWQLRKDTGGKDFYEVEVR
jgi:hypothetical protein